MHALRYMAMTIVAVLLSLAIPPNLVWAQSTAADQTILRYQRLLQRNSRDATVYYGRLDLAFRNTTAGNLLILAQSKGDRVIVALMAE